MMQRAVLKGYLDQAATGLFHCLLDGDRHFASLALAHADAAIAVTNHGQCGKAHGATTFDHFADSIDPNHFLTHAIVALLLVGLPALCFSHLNSLISLSLGLHARSRPALSRAHDNGSPNGQKQPVIKQRLWPFWPTALQPNPAE